jgi:NhaP-type Na+/H+ or K+/H+ antiporter
MRNGVQDKLTIVFLVATLFLLTSASSSSSAAGSSSSSSKNGTHAVPAHVGPHAGQTEVNTICLMLAIGLLCRRYVVPLFCGYMPYTVALLLFGMLIGASHNWTRRKYIKDSTGIETSTFDRKCNAALEPYGTCRSMWDELSIQVMHDVSPHTLVFIFLPALIFESSYFTNTHILFNNFKGVFIMANIGVVVSILVTAGFLYIVPEFWVGKNEDSITYAAWGYGPVAFMLGSILSATDAVVALLKELGASEELGVLIEGESLLNDGTAYAAFIIMQTVTRSTFAKFGVPKNSHATPIIPNAFVEGGICNITLSDFTLNDNNFCQTFNPGSGIGTFVYLVIMGVFLGFLVGYVATISIRNTINDGVSELVTTLIAAYGSFCICEAAHASGVLGVVTTGLYMSSKRTTLSHDIEEFVEEFWEMIGWILNTLIFVISGKIVGYVFGDALNEVTLYDLLLTLYIYVVCHIARGVAILVAQPFINKQCCGGRYAYYDFNWRHSVVMWWGGLRGAVGLALAMIVAEDSYWDQPWIDKDARATFKEGTVYHVGLIATMTLVINGPLTGPLVRYLGLDKARNSDLVDKVFDRQCSIMDNVLRKKVEELSSRQQASSDNTSSNYETKVTSEENELETSSKHSSKMFSLVDWKVAYSFTPASSVSVLENRLSNCEINREWLHEVNSTSEQFASSFSCCCCCCKSHNTSGDLPWELVPQWQEYARMMKLHDEKKKADQTSRNDELDIELQKQPSFHDLMGSTKIKTGKENDTGLVKRASSSFLSRALTGSLIGFDDLSSRARDQIHLAANVGLARQRFSTMVRHAYKEYFEEGVLCRSVYDSLCSAEDHFDDTLEHFFYVFSKPSFVKSMMLEKSKYGGMTTRGSFHIVRDDADNSSNDNSSINDNFTKLDDFKVDHRLNQFTSSLSLKTSVSSRLVYLGQKSRCLSIIIQKKLRQQIELAYGIASAFIQSWTHVIHSCMGDESAISHDNNIRMMVLVEGEREVATAQQVCDGLVSVYKECIATYQTYQAARVMIMSERATAKEFLEHAKISKIQCDTILKSCNRAYIRLQSSRPHRLRIIPTVRELVAPKKQTKATMSEDFIQMIQQLPGHKQDDVCNILDQFTNFIPLGRNQFVKCTKLTKNTFDVNLPFHGAGFCFVARGTLFATQVIGPMLHKKEVREKTFLNDLAQFSFLVMRDPTMGKKISNSFIKKIHHDDGHGSHSSGHGNHSSDHGRHNSGHGSGGHGSGGHGSHSSGHYSITGTEFVEMNKVFFSLPHRDELNGPEINFTDLQKMVKETLDSGADIDGNGYTGVVEMLDYLRLRTFSKQKKIKILSRYENGSVVPGMDVLISKKTNDPNECVERSHILSCRSEAILYTCGTDVTQKLCAIVPHFEDLLWKKAAVLGIKRFSTNRDAKSLAPDKLNDLIAQSTVIKKINIELDSDEHAIVYVYNAKQKNGTPWGNNWEYVIGPCEIPLQEYPHNRAIRFRVKDKNLDNLLRTSFDRSTNKNTKPLNDSKKKSTKRASSNNNNNNRKKQTRASVANARNLYKTEKVEKLTIH